MAERPTPHSLVISTLIVLTSLPPESLERCTVDDSGSGEIVYDYDEIIIIIIIIAATIKMRIVGDGILIF